MFSIRNRIARCIIAVLFAVPVFTTTGCFSSATGSAYQPKEDMTKTSATWVPTWVPAQNHREFGPYRSNADRIEIGGTDRPWIYASGYRGIKKATVKLDFLQPVVSAPIDKAPTFSLANEEGLSLAATSCSF